MRKYCLPLSLVSSLAFAEPSIDRGYEFLINGNYIGCGIPVSVMKRASVAKNVFPPSLLNSLFPIAASSVFAPSGIPGRNADNASIHPSFNVYETARGEKSMNFNCLSCHGESINGQFVIGLGNRSRDFTQDLSAFTKFLPIFAWTPSEREEVAIFSRSMDAISPYVQTKTIGVNPAINLTYALFANRNPEDFTWTKSPIMEPPSRDFPPVDVPPWWRLNLKHSMFYNAEFASNHHRIMTLASTLCIEDAEAMKELELPFLDVEAYVKSIKAPVYPLAIDNALAATGKDIFEGNCSTCHGTYGEGGEYSERVIPIQKIGTDPAFMEQQTGPEHLRFREWGEKAFMSLYGESFGVTKNRGYVAPPLNGIWATAPFLHNGSVPDLKGVLNSKDRPKFWEKLEAGTGKDYDLKNIGLKHKVLKSGQAQAPLLFKRYIYDTTLKGYGNQGHTFGDHLSEEERRAVMEYLKSL